MNIRTHLRTLLTNSYISRKDYRSLLSLRIKSEEELIKHLLQQRMIEEPDAEEVRHLLSVPVNAKRDPSPDSINPQMRSLMERAMLVAYADTTILILGESGVGKSRLARKIHGESPRRKGPFITVSCGSFPETLLESELFGVEKGAYTGAAKSREGRFRKADGGTIFLDEIGELPLSLQVKLLRVIQERKFEPLGADREEQVDVRVIAATNRNLEHDVQIGRFREDLYFRLNVVPLTILPLRDRPEDITPLTHFFIESNRKKSGRDYLMNDPHILQVLNAYSWPGNIRELENCIERLTVLSTDGTLNFHDIPERVIHEAESYLKSGYRDDRLNPLIRRLDRDDETDNSAATMEEFTKESFPTLQVMEAKWIQKALQLCDGSIQSASSLLGIHRNTLTQKIERYKIDTSLYRKKLF